MNRFVPAFKKEKQEVDLFNNSKTLNKPLLDLAPLNLKEVKTQLQKALNSSPPGIIGKFLWGNKSLSLDVERAHILSNFIASFGDKIDLFIDVEAKSLMSQRVFECRVDEIEAELRLTRERLANELVRLRDEREAIARKAEKEEEELRRYKIETQMYALRQQAEINLIGAQETEALAKAIFIKDVLGKIDVSKLPPALQTYIVSSIFNPSGNQFNDLEMQEQIKQFLIKQEKAKADKMIGEAAQEKTKAAQANYNLRMEIEDEKKYR